MSDKNKAYNQTKKEFKDSFNKKLNNHSVNLNIKTKSFSY